MVVARHYVKLHGKTMGYECIPVCPHLIDGEGRVDRTHQIEIGILRFAKSISLKLLSSNAPAWIAVAAKYSDSTIEQVKCLHGAA
jgi:hypothetical protein